MKIAIIADVLGAENNGTSITIIRLIENLKGRGHEVYVVSPSEKDDSYYYTLPKNSFGHLIDSYIEKNGVSLAKANKDILEEVIDKVDVVHIVLPFNVGHMAEKICLKKNKPFTTAFHCQPENITAHAHLMNCKPANNYFYRRFNKKFYQYAGYIHCPSEFIAGELKIHGYKSKLYPISNGVIPDFKKIEVAKPKNLEDKYCILFSGRLSREKAHDFLIHAVKKSKYEKNIQLIFCGDGPLRKKIEKLGNSLTNPPIIGYHTRDELIEIINYCDLYVHPSDVEIEAISCLEAITCGLVPIISDSDRSATNHFAIHPENLCHARDNDDLAHKIDWMIEHPEEKKKMSDEYIEYSKQFALDRCVDKMVEMFEDAIKGA